MVLVLFVKEHFVVEFKTGGKTLVCDHSNRSYGAVLLDGTVRIKFCVFSFNIEF